MTNITINTRLTAKGNTTRRLSGLTRDNFLTDTAWDNYNNKLDALCNAVVDHCNNDVTLSNRAIVRGINDIFAACPADTIPAGHEAHTDAARYLLSLSVSKSKAYTGMVDASGEKIGEKMAVALKVGKGKVKNLIIELIYFAQHGMPVPAIEHGNKTLKAAAEAAAAEAASAEAAAAEAAAAEAAAAEKGKGKNRKIA